MRWWQDVGGFIGTPRYFFLSINEDFSCGVMQQLTWLQSCQQHPNIGLLYLNNYFGIWSPLWTQTLMSAVQKTNFCVLLACTCSWTEKLFRISLFFPARFPPSPFICHWAVRTPVCLEFSRNQRLSQNSARVFTSPNDLALPELLMAKGNTHLSGMRCVSFLLISCLELTFVWQAYNNKTKQKYRNIASKMFMNFLLCIKCNVSTKQLSRACFYLSIWFYKPQWCWFAFLPFTNWPINPLTLRYPSVQSTPTYFCVQWPSTAQTRENKNCWQEAESFPASEFSSQVAHRSEGVFSTSQKHLYVLSI